MGEFIQAKQVNGIFTNPWASEEGLNFTLCRKQARKAVSISNPTKTELDSAPELRVLNVNRKILTRPPDLGVQVTWLGHSTVLFQLNGINILCDPVLSKKVGGATRYRDAPCPVDNLPEIDAVVISHDHFDHLDINTISSLNNTFSSTITWFVPMGVKSLLPKGCSRVVELSWWGEHQFHKVLTQRINSIRTESSNAELYPDSNVNDTALMVEATFVLVPTHHSCQRQRKDINTRLWGGWAILGTQKRIFFCGDTAYCNIFTTIGSRYGPFDVAAIPIGGYKPMDIMGRINCDPEQAVQIHQDIRAIRSIGIHWGTFNIGCEHFLEPLKFLRLAAQRAGLSEECFVCLRHGETRVFGGKYEGNEQVNNENFYSSSKNQSSKIYNYHRRDELANEQTTSIPSRSSVCVIL